MRRLLVSLLAAVAVSAFPAQPASALCEDLGPACHPVATTCATSPEVCGAFHEACLVDLESPMCAPWWHCRVFDAWCMDGGLVCNGSQIFSGEYGVLTIDPDGDVTVDGDQVVSCPPHDA